MSKHQVKVMLKRELHALNNAIDRKILKGLPYEREAREHKLLKARLGLLNKHTFLARTMRVAYMFMF